MSVTGSKIIRMTADNDQIDTGHKRLKIKGVRLVAGTGADANAQLRERDSNGQILYSLAAVQKTADEAVLDTLVDSGLLFLDLSGTGAEVFVYVE